MRSGSIAVRRILHGASKDFTLIETLLALAVFGLAAVVLTTSFYDAQRALEWEVRSLTYEKMADWAVDRILELKLDRDAMEKGDRVSTLDGGNLDWTATVDDTRLLDCFQVTFSLSFSAASEDDDVPLTVSRLVYAPEWSEDKDRALLLKEKLERFESRKARMLP